MLTDDEFYNLWKTDVLNHIQVIYKKGYDDAKQELKRASTCAYYADNIALYDDINYYLEHPGTETSNDLINDINYLITKFEDGKDANDYWRDISDLRYNLLNVGEALFAPPKPEQEPVAWMYDLDMMIHPIANTRSQRFGELTSIDPTNRQQDAVNIRPLYIAPAKREQEPLSFGEIEDGRDNNKSYGYTCGFEDGVRWAEQQHGIGVSNE